METVNTVYTTQQEEDERQRRLMDKEESISRKVNAQGIANLVKEASFANAGSAHSEEMERERRLQNRDEAVARKVNAQETANLISSLHGGSAHSEEQEKERRIQNRDEAVAHKVLAQEVANLIKEEEPLVDHSVTRQLEEEERTRRIQDDNNAISNAHVVAYITENGPSRPLSRGTPTYSTFLEEKERKRRVAELANDQAPRIHALNVAHIIKDAKIPKVTVPDRGAHLLTCKIEEDERRRRIDDKYEAVSRRMHSQKISRDIQIQGSILKARLRHHGAAPAPTNEAPIVQVISAVNSTYNTVAPAVRFMTLVGIGMAMSAGNAAATRFPTAASYVPNVTSMWDKVRSFVRGTVQAYTPERSRSQELHIIKTLEEDERFRRILEDSASKIPEANARRIAKLFKNPQTPIAHNKGFSKFTSRAEEKERARRIANKDEATCSRMNAQRTANMITQHFAGKSGSGHTGSTHQLEEEERARRMAEDAFATRWGARKVASIIHEVFFPTQDKAFIYAYTQGLEEAERARRIKDPSPAVHNAHRVSALFTSRNSNNDNSDNSHPASTENKSSLEGQRALVLSSDAIEGSPQIDLSLTKRMARRFSLLSGQDADQTYEREPTKLLEDIQSAQDNASNINHIISQDVNLLQENERESRIADKLWQQQARDNAYKASGLVKSYFKQKKAQEKTHHDTPVPTPYFTENSPPPFLASHALLTAPAHAFPIPESPTVIQQIAPAHMPPAADAEPYYPSRPTISFTSVRYMPQQQEQQHHDDIQPYPASHLNTLAAPHTTGQAASVKRHNSLRQTFSKRLSKEPSAASSLRDIQLLENVRKLYEQELQLAKKELDKAERLKGKVDMNKGGVFGDYRLQRHQAAALKHQKAAERHRQWLDDKESVIASTPSL